MRYVILVCLLSLCIAFDLAVFIAASDHPLETFDPLHPATLLPLVTSRLDALRAQVRELDVNALFDVLAAPYRKQRQDESPTPSPGP
jgi:hypothetical protein